MYMYTYTLFRSRLARENEAIKRSLKDYDEALERYLFLYIYK